MNNIFRFSTNTIEINNVLKSNFKVGDIVTILFNSSKCIFQLAEITCNGSGSVKATYGLTTKGNLRENSFFGLTDCAFRLATIDEIVCLTEKVGSGLNQVSYEKKECKMPLDLFKTGDIVTTHFVYDGEMVRCIVMLKDSPNPNSRACLPSIYGLDAKDKLMINHTFGYNPNTHGIRYANDEEIAELLNAIATANHKEKKTKKTIKIIEEDIWE